MNNQLIIKVDSKNYIFKAKEEIQNQKFQEVLKKAKENNLQIFCQCNNVRMQVKKINDKFYLSSYPNRKKQHSIFCDFSGSIYDFYKKEEDKIVLSNLNLFLETSNSSSKEGTSSKEIQKTVKFYSLILNLLDSSYAQSFNFKNKGKDRISGDLENPELELVFKNFIKNFINLKLKNGYDFYETFKEKGLSFKLGKVYQIGENFIKTKTYFKGNFQTEVVKIKENILENALKNVQIFENKINPPYFFFLIKKKRTVQRLFLYPIVDSEYFLPVESELEREKVKKFAEKYPVYKSILTNSINSVLTKKYSSIYNRDNDIIPRPDLFVFTENEIVIVEIVGMKNDKKYLQRVKEKEVFYKNLPKPFKYGRIVKR